MNKLAGPRQRRRRRAGEEVREAGLAAARKLLLSGGPAAVTVANIGREIGTSHANVLHHFGSAGELRTALMGSMIRDLTTVLDDAVARIRSDEAAPRTLVEQVFDAFDEGGAGHLAAWIALSRDFEHLEPIREAVATLVEAIREKLGEEADPRIRSAVLMIAVGAFGDAVIGPYLRDMLGLPEGAMRDLTARQLARLIPPAEEPA